MVGNNQTIKNSPIGYFKARKVDLLLAAFS
jgi:hypothetical protein